MNEYMAKFMGNGIRILHVIQSLCSDCTMKIYHCNSKTSFNCCGIHEAVDYITQCGYQDIFFLEISHRGEI